eukprot:CAMPEP_0174332098 /NCGR_PEP_ID=MMETSP0810-20121108/18034_1 /TAXON_ID=73025 ORGANISM="Eutreptiella gymnastica-like, Strain CCMP1594" /NCGR_SAMPLE_ID=MMETSP0810 /ASSEMBLY_ACC=CAM_ASM_000659 /LENGTH=49 /DNA_ID=CAMNT_0015448319 /DNA_START=239 /DNA_END=388 /DNA_ORIENTATION=-
MVAEQHARQHLVVIPCWFIFMLDNEYGHKVQQSLGSASAEPPPGFVVHV